MFYNNKYKVMRFIINSTFSLNVSRKGYDSKENVKEALSTKKYSEKLAFKESKVSILDFINATSNGYAFAGLFSPVEEVNEWGNTIYPYYSDGSLKITFKKKKYFKGSQVVFVDIDETSYKDVKEYLDLLSWKPTVTYTTFSDSADSRRFRLVYVFDQVLDAEQYSTAYYMIARRINSDTGEGIKDNCGSIVNQYMNGTGKNAEIHSTNIIYSWKDIVGEYYSVNKMNEIDYNNVINNIINNSNNTYNINIHTTYSSYSQNSEHFESIIIQEDRTGSYDIELDDNYYHLLDWAFSNPNKPFYGDGQSYFYEPELFVEGHEGFKYAKIDSMNMFLPADHSKYMDRYFKLFYYVDLAQDKENRRKDIYKRMCLRRLMRPEASPEQIAYCAYIDIKRFMDNSDKVFNADFIKRNVERAFRESFQKIKDTYSNDIEFLVDHTTPVKGYRYYFEKDNYSTGKLQTAKHLVMFESVIKEYDPSKPVKENLEYLHSLGIMVSERALYDYLKKAGVDLNESYQNKVDHVRGLINDSNCTVRGMRIVLESMGIKITNKVLGELIKEYKNNRK